MGVNGGTRLRLEIELIPAGGAVDEGARAVISAMGEIDLETVGQLADSLEPDLWADCDGVLVDLCDVRFMDSTGVHTILQAQHRLGASGARLAVATQPRSQVEGVLELTGVRDRLPSSL